MLLSPAVTQCYHACTQHDRALASAFLLIPALRYVLWSAVSLHSLVMVYCWLVHITWNPGKKEEVHSSQLSETLHTRTQQSPASHSKTTQTAHPTLSTPAHPSTPSLSLSLQWLQHWSAIAAHCRTYEPSCLSYELYQDEKDPNSAIIFERYVTEQDLTVTHRQSAPFLALRQRSQEAQLVKESKSRGYHEAGIGFVSRAEVTQ